MRLSDKVAIVTGSGRGIGRGIALAFASEGADIVVNVSKSLEEGEKVVREIEKLGQRGSIVQADVADEGDVKQMVRETLKTYGKIDVLVNNAGVMASRGGFEGVTMEDWDRVMNVNLRGLFMCSQYVGKEMIKQQRGNIINIASTACFMAYPLSGPYPASKSGVIELTKDMAIEWARHNIRVNAICPGTIHTSMTEAALSNKDTYDWIVKMIPLGRVGLPSDIAKSAVFLASDESSYITAQVIIVDGGETENLGRVFKRYDW
jgi:3-oxoacyl-[acyl-carrier protein] reductase